MSEICPLNLFLFVGEKVWKFETAEKEKENVVFEK